MSRWPLRDMSVDDFLRKHWQKKPLLLRDALPDIKDLFKARELIELAGRDDVESRLVTRERGRWQVRSGPFRRKALMGLPARGWSLLVQGVDSHLPQARALMQRFAFIPYARQDDLMISIAPDGAGVGPHFDSYDVFLLQAQGHRRWQLSTQSDLALIERAPLKILRRFHPCREIDVGPGDMLYLPPRVAHNGIARGESMTCSIGFRAPSHHELAVGFLDWLQEKPRLAGRYADPDLAYQRHPAKLSNAMVTQVESIIGSLHWSRRDIVCFLGQYLSEPKPHIWFDRPEPALARTAFARRARTRGVRLSNKSRMLFTGDRFFINGESLNAKGLARPLRNALQTLADAGELTSWVFSQGQIGETMHSWYKHGYVELR